MCLFYNDFIILQVLLIFLIQKINFYYLEKMIEIFAPTISIYEIYFDV